MTKKKILICGINYFPEQVGIGKYTFEMSSWLARNGFEVKVITANKYFPDWNLETNNYKYEKIEGVDVIRCPIWVPKNPKGISRIIHLLSFVITSFPPLVKNIFWGPNLLTLIAPSLLSAPIVLIFKLFLSKKKFKSWIHIQDFEIDVAFNLGILKGILIKKVALFLEYKILNQFDIVSTISKGMVEKAFKKGINKNKVKLFPNWFDFDSYDLNNMSSRLQTKYFFFKKLFKDKIVLMYSGSMNKKQNFDLLVECIKYFQENKKILWVISGSGPSKTLFKEQVKNYKNVKIYNLQPAYFFNHWLSLADIHLLPQKRGISNLVLPSKIIAILASSKPVIACTEKNSELDYYVSKAGISIRDYKTKTFINALEQLIKDKENGKKRVFEGYTLSKEMFDKKIILQNFKKEIDQLLIL